MSVSALKKMKKELLLINKNSKKDMFVIQASDGLFLIDLSKIDEGRITKIEEAPNGMNIEVINANMKDILVCGGFGDKPVLIIGDLEDEDVDVSNDIDIISLVPAFKDI